MRNEVVGVCGRAVEVRGWVCKKVDFCAIAQ